MIAWIEWSVRHVNQCHRFHEDTGSNSRAMFPGKVSPYGNQVQFENGFHSPASARRGNSVRAHSRADTGFDMTLHDRCNLLVRGACGNRQVGCRRPSGRCAGTHEKGPPHLSRSCVVRVGGRQHRSGSRLINRIRRKWASSVPGMRHREFCFLPCSGSSLVRAETHGSSDEDTGRAWHRKTSGHA